MPRALAPFDVALPVKDINLDNISPANDSNFSFLPVGNIFPLFATFKINSDNNEINSDHVLSSPARTTPVNNSFVLPVTGEEIYSGIALSPTFDGDKAKIYLLPSNFFPMLFFTLMISPSKTILDTTINPFLHQFCLIFQYSTTHKSLSLPTSPTDRRNTPAVLSSFTTSTHSAIIQKIRRRSCILKCSLQKKKRGPRKLRLTRLITFTNLQSAFLNQDLIVEVMS